MPRKTPVLLRKGPVTGTIQALTNYRWRNGGRVLQATDTGKHDVTADYDALTLETLLDPDAQEAACIIDQVIKGVPITAMQRKELRAFHGHLAAIIERHNTTGHGRQSEAA
jgi:hypothetical protein